MVRVHPDQQQCDPRELRGSPVARPSLGWGKVITRGWTLWPLSHGQLPPGACWTGRADHRQVSGPLGMALEMGSAAQSGPLGETAKG